MDVKHYQKIIDTMNLIKILSIGENEIKNNKIFTHDQINERINTILEKGKKCAFHRSFDFN